MPLTKIDIKYPAAAPPVFVDVMYQNQPGAIFDGVSEYTLPCNDMVTVEIVIGLESLACVHQKKHS